MKVKDIMTRDVITVHPTTIVEDIAYLLTKYCLGGVPVVDDERRVVGIVTESDLFVRKEPLLRSHHTFPSLFKVPVLLERLPEIYAERGSRFSAADVMTRKLIWVTEDDTVSNIVRLMMKFGIERLPVLTAAPEVGGRLVGIITRSDIVRTLMQEER